jgi:hypothetical protein
MFKNNNHNQNSSSLYSNGCSTPNETTKLMRKTSRKILERKSGIEYDDDDINLINAVASSSSDEIIDASHQHQESVINEADEIFYDTEENNSLKNDDIEDESDIEQQQHISRNLNSAFDELFAAAQSDDTSATAAVEVKLAEATAAANQERKSNNSTNSSSPTSANLSRRRSSHQKNSSNTNIQTPKSNYLNLIDAEGYLGSPQQLTRSCSCKRPGSFKKMRSRNVNNQQITTRTSSDHSKIDETVLNNNNNQHIITINNYSTSDELENAAVKPSNRAGSLPFETLDNNSRNLDTYRMRCFNITPKGAIVNRGDSFKRSFKRSSRSIAQQVDSLNNHVDNNNNNNNNENHNQLLPPTEQQQQQHQKQQLSTPILLLSQPTDDGSMKADDGNDGVYYPGRKNKFSILKNNNGNEKNRINLINGIENIDTFVVYLMGGIGVGKNSMTKQFKTSEYRGTYDINGSIEELEESVSVMLDGVESRLIFLPVDFESVSYY